MGNKKTKIHFTRTFLLVHLYNISDILTIATPGELSRSFVRRSVLILLFVALKACSQMQLEEKKRSERLGCSISKGNNNLSVVTIGHFLMLGYKTSKPLGVISLKDLRTCFGLGITQTKRFS